MSMYRTYKLTEQESGKITVYRWDGDTGYYDIFDTVEEYEAEQARLQRIDEECRQKHEEYARALQAETETEQTTATIRIEPAEYGYDYSIGEKICGDEEEFEEHFVIAGNNRMNEYTNASWWTEARIILAEIDLYIDDIIEHGFEQAGIKEMTAENAPALIKAYQCMKSLDDIDGIVKALNILHPDRHYDSHRINGCTQGEWQYVICEESDADRIDRISAYYWGNVSCLFYAEECIRAIIDDDTLDTWEASGILSDELRVIFDIDSDTVIEAYRFDGYTQTASYTQIL